MVTWVKGEIATADKLNSTFAEEAGKVASIAALKALRIPKDGDSLTVILDGYYAANDGGGGTFIWSATASNDDDGGTIIQPNSAPASGRWLRLFSGTVNVKWLGAKGDNTNDDTAAIQAACNIANSVYAPNGNYKVTANINVPQGVKVFGDGWTRTYFQKAFNGDMFTMGAYAVLRDLQITGNGATYTGRGVVISSGNGQLIDGCWIVDHAGYCVEYTAAQAGSNSIITNSVLYTHTLTTLEAVKYPDDGATPSDRGLHNIHCFGGLLANFYNCQTTLVTGCDAIGVTFGPNAKKVTMTGNRMAGGTNNVVVDVYGQDHVIVGNAIATYVRLNSGVSNCTVENNTLAAGNANVDNAGNGSNSIDITGTYTPAWTAATTNPAIENGTITGSYVRRGKLITVTIKLVPGSTTTFGSGEYTFGLPFTNYSGQPAVGSVQSLNSGTNFEVGAILQNGGQNANSQIYYQGGGTAMSPTVPHTWKPGDTMTATLTYQIG